MLGILGTGVQARLQAELHAAVLPLTEVHVWGRNPERAAACARDIGVRLPGVRVVAVAFARGGRRSARASSSPRPPRARRCSRAADVRPGMHISAVGSDSPGKQELDPEILRRASLLLVDSLAQCAKLGELQHALSEKARAIEIGAFCDAPSTYDRAGVTVADFTGLGAEDLFIAEACTARLAPR